MNIKDRNRAIFYAAWNCLLRPDRDLSDLARTHGVSRERVRQIKHVSTMTLPWQERKPRRTAALSRKLMVDYIHDVREL